MNTKLKEKHLLKSFLITFLTVMSKLKLYMHIKLYQSLKSLNLTNILAK